MKNSAIIASLKMLGAFIFGQPLYVERELIAANVTGKVEKNNFGADVLRLENEENPKEFTLIPLRSGTPVTKTSFDIKRFEAVETRKGIVKATGKAWEVQKGKSVAFAM